MVSDDDPTPEVPRTNMFAPALVDCITGAAFGVCLVALDEDERAAITDRLRVTLDVIREEADRG